MNKFSWFADLQKSGANLMIFLHIIVKKKGFLIFAFAGLPEERCQNSGNAVLFRTCHFYSRVADGSRSDREICHILKDELGVHIVVIVFTCISTPGTSPKSILVVFSS